MSESKYLKVALDLLGHRKRFTLKKETGAEWRRFFVFCQSEGVSLHLAKHLSALRRAGCPQEIVLTVQLETAIAKSNHEKKLKTLDLIETEAKSAGIPVVPLKGCLYHSLGLEIAAFRVMSDIDILTPPERVEELVRRLQSVGIERPLHTNSHRFHAELLRKWTPFGTSPQGRAPLVSTSSLVDLHWAPTYYLDGELISLEVKELWKRAEPASLQNLPLTFFLTHTLIHCINAASEPNGLTLSRLWDVKALIERSAAHLKDLRPYWRAENEAHVSSLLKEFWGAANALGDGEFLPFSELRQRSYKPAPVEHIRPPHIIREVKSVSDRVKVIAGYFLKS